MRIAILVAVAMMAFAANSILARLALGDGETGAVGYTGIRLLAGAATLTVIHQIRKRDAERSALRIHGSWSGAAALFGYAFAFSLAYILLGAATGALILFASVQFGMVAWALRRGDRPGRLEWVGFAVAFGALVLLVSPGLVAPHPLGALLMVAAGLCWAAYSLLGQGSREPLADTAGNFIRCAPIALVLAVAGELTHASSGAGLAYAVASGAVASGMGYAIWYAALPGLTRTSAAFIQLTVPPITAVGGVLLIGEPLTHQLVLSSLGILGGIALSLVAARQRRARLSQGST